MRVNTKECNTVEEELAHIEEQINGVGNFFACDVHPSAVRAAEATSKRLWRKRSRLIRSLEYIYYHLGNCPDLQLSDEIKIRLAQVDPYKN